MEALRLVLLYVHLIGFALLLGGAATQWFTGTTRINTAMLWGSVVQVVTGLGLSAPLRGGGDAEPEVAKLVVKLVIGILVFVMVFVPRRRTEVNRGHFIGIAVLTLTNAAVAVFWR